MKAHKEDSSGYAREKFVGGDTLGEFAALLEKQYQQHPGAPRWRLLASAAQQRAIAHLKSKGLPTSGSMFKNPSSGTWSNIPPVASAADPTDLTVMAGWTIVSFEHYITREHDGGRLDRLAVRLLVLATSMEHAAALGKTDAMAHCGIELGQIMGLFQAHAVAAEGGRRPPPKKPWQQYADRLITQHPGQAKDALWRRIPIEGQSEGDKSAGWRVTRNDANTGLIACDSTEGRVTLTRGQFFKHYLRTRRKPKK